MQTVQERGALLVGDGASKNVNPYNLGFWKETPGGTTLQHEGSLQKQMGTAFVARPVAIAQRVRV